jgi:Holliday junction resolvase RusA-like endonuclease
MSYESVIDIKMAPFAKARPRVTRNATYMPRKYVQARDKLRALYLEQGGELNVEGLVKLNLTFVFAMPKSWSKKRKAATEGKWCLKKPDLDNCAILANDSHVASLDCHKVWGYEDRIFIILKAEEPWEYIPF